jgi:hypothetical protein
VHYFGHYTISFQNAGPYNIKRHKEINKERTINSNVKKERRVKVKKEEKNELRTFSGMQHHVIS